MFILLFFSCFLFSTSNVIGKIKKIKKKSYTSHNLAHTLLKDDWLEGRYAETLLTTRCWRYRVGTKISRDLPVGKNFALSHLVHILVVDL